MRGKEEIEKVRGKKEDSKRRKGIGREKKFKNKKE